MSIGTLLFTWAKGQLVGTDTQGNRYYVERKAVRGRKARRWVLYKGAVEASKVPAEWHAWLHYTVDQPLQPADDKPWVKDHSANMSGTSAAYLPAGHDLRGGERAKATGDYEAWQP
jgi:NADH:ubiquinone oxidoreductase subunit